MRRENEQVVFESDVIFVGRHAHESRQYQDRGDGARYPWDNYGEKRTKTWLNLCEAAARAHTSVEELKRAVRRGELRAERRGWMRIHVGDLNEWRYRV